MKQVLQSLRDGSTDVRDIPAPMATRGKLVIATSRTLVSSGTERMLVEFGKAGIIGKARQQPDKVKAVLQKIRTDGVKPTLDAVFNKLDQPTPLGYCNVGVVVDVGAGVSGFQLGDRVVSNGKHAEVVSVPQNLCAKIPDNVSDDVAAFTVLSAIGLQGIRLAKPQIGETFAVMGLGIIGLITVQLLRANGCRVIGFDFDANRLELAKSFGAEVVNLAKTGDPVAHAMSFSKGIGIDGVLVTAATTSNEPMTQAAQMSRKRGRIVLVGVAGLDLSRADYYEKELTFQVSCSYGPGRYDPNYEDKGIDYPPAFVRWTEQRNFEAVLDLLSQERLSMDKLISHRFSIDNAAAAYELIMEGKPSLGILLDYPHSVAAAAQRVVELRPGTDRPDSPPGQPGISFIGAGNYASAVLIPAFKAADPNLSMVVSENGLSARSAAEKFDFSRAVTDRQLAMGDRDTNAVVICTRHDTHAELVCEALAAGKHVFVEKPLALTLEEINQIEAAMESATREFGPRRLMVGFNRRFAPLVVEMKEALSGLSGGPLSMVMTINAGDIPSGHWAQDPDIGGGRLIGEACHFIDLLRFIAASPIKKAEKVTMSSRNTDTFSIAMQFENGSIGTVNYFANGHKSLSKERLEVFADGRVLQLDNFRKLTGIGGGFDRMKKGGKQDKGQAACASAFVNSLQHGGKSPIDFAEILEVSRHVVDLARR